MSYSKYIWRKRLILMGAATVLAACKNATIANEGMIENFDSAVYADMIIINAKVTTQDKNKPVAQAIAVRDGKILDVDTDEIIHQYRGETTEVIDAKNRRVIPGLIDSHSHFLRSGLAYTRELRWDGVPDLKTALNMLSKQASRTPKGEWVRIIGGWSPWQFKEKRLPTIAEINKAAPDTPVYIQYFYSVGMLNQMGMDKLGINRNTEDPKGGKFVRDSHGTPTGLMLAQPHPGIFYGKIAALPDTSEEVKVNSTIHLFHELAKFGLTSVIDAGGGGFGYPDGYSVAEKLATEGKLPLRTSFYLFAQNPGKELEDYHDWTRGNKAGTNTDSTKEHGFEIDGGGEYLLWKAGDFENFRSDRPVLDADMEKDLTPIIELLVERRWPFRIHATYDESITRILDVIEDVNSYKPLRGLRWSIEHAETIGLKNIERIKSLGGGVAIQSRMVFLGDDFSERYGAEKAKATPPLRMLVDKGIPIGMGTDATRGSTFNPWVGLHYLVTGETVSGRKLYESSNLLTREEALRLYTIGSAWFSGEEHIKGRLSKGQLADFAILSKDYMEVPLKEIKSIRSVLTVVDGEVVYGDGDYQSLSPKLEPLLPSWSPVKFYGSYWP
ncbi:amidohydrolase [Microbulbifer sp. ZKSA002]|uniref:amidohydrolase n=1 Tax=unclassified Microbulbifer TaxID=2619833 RepID=UPI0040392119